MPSDTLSTAPHDSGGDTGARAGILPCHNYDPDLWFAETPDGLERAKELCTACPVRSRCLAAALDREEPWGVWGGEILDRGVIVARKRPRGRPRKNPVVTDPDKELVCA